MQPNNFLNDYDPFHWMNDEAKNRFKKWDDRIRHVKESIRSRDVSEYWRSGIKGAVKTAEGSTLEQALQLSQLIKVTTNFVRILTHDPDIIVEFKGAGVGSYTDGKTVTISADPTQFDIIVGTALHEASHCVYTPMKEIFRLLGTDGVPQTLLPLNSPTLKVMEWCKKVGINVTRDEILSNLHLIINAIEDRRIDDLTFTNAPGYRGYYEKLYEEYWNNDKISESLKIDWMTSDVDSYINRIINISNPYARLTEDSLAGMKLIHDLIDLPNIDRWNTLGDRALATEICDVAATVYMLILGMVVGNQSTCQNANLCKLAKDLVNSQPSMNNGEGELDSSDDLRKKMNDLLNDDQYEMNENDFAVDIPDTAADVSDPPSLGNTEKQKRVSQQRKNRRFVVGNATKKTISSTLIDKVEAISRADAKMNDISECVAPWNLAGDEDLPRHVECMVVKNVTESVISSGVFSHLGLNIVKTQKWTESPNEVSIREGRKWGHRLSRNLLLRNDSTTTKFTRRSTGNIDRRLLSSLGYDNDQIFYKEYVTEFNPTIIHISLDQSSSMRGPLWQNAIKVATAFAVAATKIQNLDVVISTRTHADMTPVLFVVYDSRKDHIKKINIFQHFHAVGVTPEGLLYPSIISEMESYPSHYNKIFINICDGLPMASGIGSENSGAWQYNGEHARNHTREMYRRMKQFGYGVWSYMVGRSTPSPERLEDDEFWQIFHPDASYVDANGFNQIVKTMNAVLLEETQKNVRQI